MEVLRLRDIRACRMISRVSLSASARASNRTSSDIWSTKMVTHVCTISFSKWPKKCFLIVYGDFKWNCIFYLDMDHFWPKIHPKRTNRLQHEPSQWNVRYGPIEASGSLQTKINRDYDDTYYTNYLISETFTPINASKQL